MSMELVYLGVVSGIFGIITLIVYQSGNIKSWAMKMDYKQGEYEHKQKLEKIKGTQKVNVQLLKQAEKQEGGLDLSQVGDIVENVKDLVEGSEDSDNPLVKLLGSDLVQGIIKKIPSLKKKEDTQEDTGEWAS